MTCDNLRNFLYGAVRIWEEEGYVLFSRFTKKQEDVLDSRGYALHKTCSSGMRLEFTTKGGEFSFDYTGGIGCSAALFGIEVLIDELPVYNYFVEEIPTDKTLLYVVKPSATPRKVAVYFPNLAQIKIKNLKLPEDAQPVKKDLKLLTLGDSITHGYMSKHQNFTYANVLSDELCAELLNQGIGGDKFFADNLDESLPFDPDIITVAYAFNDWASKLIFGEDMPKYLEKLDRIYHDKKIFILRPIYYKYEESLVGGHTLVESSLHIEKCASNYPNMTVIDCHEFVPPLPDFYYDQIMIHPNDLGYIFYGKNLASAIKKHLK